MAASNDGTIRVASVLEPGPMVGAINKIIGSLGKFATKLGVVGTALTIGLGIALFAVGKQILKSAKEIKGYQLQVVELAKVLSGGIPEAQVVARHIGQLSKVMPTARAELFEVAEIAARLGIRGVGNIKEFTRVASMLGVATNISAEQAADAFARILKQTKSGVDTFEQLGSVVNELANNMATSTKEIVESMRRSAPDMARIGFSGGEIAAVAATLNEVSESASRAGTRLRRFAQSISDPSKLKVFADAIEMTATDLRHLFKIDPVAGLFKIVEAFNEGGEAADKMASRLDSRVRMVLAQLGQNIGGLQMAMRLYNEQMENSTSLSREYALFTDTLAGKQQMLTNRMQETRTEIGLKLIPLLENLLAIRLKVATWLNELFQDKLDLAAPREEVDKFREDWDGLRDSIHDAIAESMKAEGIQMFGQGQGGITYESPATANFATVLKNQIEADAMMKQMVENAERSIENLAVTGGAAFGLLTAHMKAVAREGARIGETSKDFAMVNTVLRQGNADVAAWGSAMATMDLALMDADAGMQAMATSTFLEWERRLEAGINLTVADFIPALISLAHWIGFSGKEALEAAAKQQVWSDKAADVIARLKQQKQEMIYGKLEALRHGEIWDNATDIQKRNIDGLIEWIEAEELRLELLEEEEDRLKELKEAREDELESFQDLIQSLRDDTALAKAKDDADKKRVERMIEMRDGLEGLTLMHQAMALALYAERFAAEDLAEALEVVETEQQKMEKAIAKKLADMNLETLASQFRLMERVIEGMADSMVEMFEAIATGSGNAGEAVIRMIKDIAAELLKAQIMKFLFNLAAKHGLGPFDPNTTLTTYASGGSIKKGQLSVVGERGPELFVPRMAGQIIPNHKLDSGPQEITITNHYTIQALDGASVREILTREQNTIAGLAMDTISRHRTLKRN